MEALVFQYAGKNATMGLVLPQMCANVKADMEEKIVQNLVHLVDGDLLVRIAALATMVPLAIQYLGNVPVRLDGKGSGVTPSALTRGMARDAERYASVKMVVCVITNQELVVVLLDGAELYVMIHVHLELMEPIVQVLVFVKTKETATQ